MNHLIFSIIESNLKVDIVDLADIFNVDKQKALNILDTDGKWYNIKRNIYILKISIIYKNKIKIII